jgi:hypothetical protein
MVAIDWVGSLGMGGNAVKVISLRFSMKNESLTYVATMLIVVTLFEAYMGLLK